MTAIFTRLSNTIFEMFVYVLANHFRKKNDGFTIEERAMSAVQSARKPYNENVSFHFYTSQVELQYPEGSEYHFVLTVTSPDGEATTYFMEDIFNLLKFTKLLSHMETLDIQNPETEE